MICCLDKPWETCDGSTLLHISWILGLLRFLPIPVELKLTDLCTGGPGEIANQQTRGSNEYRPSRFTRPPLTAPARCKNYFSLRKKLLPTKYNEQIRVCEMCIRNDVNIGRIIHCGMCGVVACDEDCGPVMYECTGEFPSLRDLEAGPAFFRPRRGHFSRAARRRRKALKQGPFVLYHFFLHFIFLPKHYRLFLSKTMRSGTTPDASIAAPSPTSLSSRSSAAAPQMASHAPPASASRAYQPSRRGSATTSNAAIFAAGGGWCRVTSWS